MEDLILTPQIWLDGSLLILVLALVVWVSLLLIRLFK